jgi:hypothetical protein
MVSLYKLCKAVLLLFLLIIIRILIMKYIYNC